MGLLTPSALLNKGIIFKYGIKLFTIDNIEFNKLLRLSAIRTVNSLFLKGKNLKYYL